MEQQRRRAWGWEAIAMWTSSAARLRGGLYTVAERGLEDWGLPW